MTRLGGRVTHAPSWLVELQRSGEELVLVDRPAALVVRLGHETGDLVAV